MKQGDVNGSEAGQQQNSAETEREPTKAELEAEFDPNDEELTQAATRIQACFRGHMARKEPEAEAEADKKGEGQQGGFQHIKTFGKLKESFPTLTGKRSNMGVGTEGKKLWTERGRKIQAEEKKNPREC